MSSTDGMDAVPLPQVSAPGAPGFRAVAAVVIAYAVAMAFLESAVVVYLQRALEIDPRALFPVRDPALTGDLALIEVGREAATLVMLGAVGWLAGRSGLERLAWTAVAFGTWDILYYAWLWVVHRLAAVARHVGPALPHPGAVDRAGLDSGGGQPGARRVRPRRGPTPPRGQAGAGGSRPGCRGRRRRAGRRSSASAGTPRSCWTAGCRRLPMAGLRRRPGPRGGGRDVGAAGFGRPPGDGRTVTDEPADLEYVGLMALAWDALRGDTSNWEDRAWFLRLVRERGEPVLDVGCGTGRILLDFLAQGIDIDGLEISEDMLAVCRTNAAESGVDVAGRLFRQAMELMSLPRHYRTIIVPSSSFQLVLDPAAAVEALRRFHAHLVPGGTLALPFYTYDRAADESWTEEAGLADGSVVRRTSRGWVDAGARLEHTDDRWELLRDGTVVATQHQVRSPATRGYVPDDVRALLEQAGFVDLAFHHGFTWDPIDVDEQLFSVVARRPEA